MHANPSRRRARGLWLAALVVAAGLAPREPEHGRAAAHDPAHRIDAHHRLHTAPEAGDAWGEGRRWGLCLGWMAASGLAGAIGTAGGGPLVGIVVFAALLPPVLDACA